MTQEVDDLAEAVAALREGRGRDVRFGLGDAELTMQPEADRYAGKIGRSVLGGACRGKSEQTQSVKLVPQPCFRQADGSYSGDFRIADRPDGTPGVGASRT